MLPLTIIALLFSTAYVVLMLLYREGWRRQPYFKPDDDFIPATTITVVIPARNEAERIGACITAVLSQQYPRYLMEVIVVDDHSTDGTWDIMAAFKDERVKAIRLADYIKPGDNVTAYKKRAIDTAIGLSGGALIVTTDADCIMGGKWLYNIAAIYQEQQPVLVIGPVAFITRNLIVEQFQSIDFMSMQGITAAAHQLKMGNMCNGANLAYSKKAYYDVGGYAGIDHLASGDDYLLMMKLQKKIPGQVSYLKNEEATVWTMPQPDWGSFLQQRIRWASKSGKYDDKKLTGILLFVYCYNLLLFGTLIVGLFNMAVFSLFAAMLAVKIVTELYYLWPVARFFRKRKELNLFPFLQLLHIAYIVLAGFLGFAGIYKWKGRTVK